MQQLALDLQQVAWLRRAGNNIHTREIIRKEKGVNRQISNYNQENNGEGKIIYRKSYVP